METTTTAKWTWCARCARARRSVLVVDHSKFGRTPAVRLGCLTEVSAIVTDQPLPPGIQRLLRGHAVEVLEGAGVAPSRPGKRKSGG